MRRLTIATFVSLLWPAGRARARRGVSVFQVCVCLLFGTAIRKRTGTSRNRHDETTRVQTHDTGVRREGFSFSDADTRKVALFCFHFTRAASLA